MTQVNDKYIQLYGREGTSKGTDIDMSEHGRVGDVSTGQPYKHVAIVDPTNGYKAAVTSDGKLEVNASVTATGADGAILDGANNAIKATVKDLTNSNPLTVAVTDANGDQITSFGGTPAGSVDSNNSTTSTLLAAGVFTGTGTDILNYSGITVLVDADVAGTLKAQFSPDNSDWHDGEEYAIPGMAAGSAKFFTPPVQGRYFRLVYTNGGVGQTRFHIHTVLKPNPVKWSSHNINDNLHDDDDAELTASVLKLRTAQDTYVSGSATNGGNFKVSLEEWNGSIQTNGLPIQLPPGTINSFGQVMTGSINNQIDIQFYRSDGSVGDLVTETNANGGTASATNGMATFSATTTANSQAKGVSTTSTTYTANSEIYCVFTAGFTGTGAGTSYQRIGLYNGTDGFFIGKEANSFGVTVIKGGSPVTVAKADFNVDTLTGAADSLFLRDGSPEAINLANLNVWRIRFGWVGSAPIEFEVLSPDGRWVTFHQIKQPNNSALPSINTADLPITCDVNSGNSGNALTIITNCWVAGTTQSLAKINSSITSNNLAGLTRSVITGETTAGGGGFVNVKVNPSGTLETNATISSLPNEGQQTMANSISVAVASDQSAVPISAASLPLPTGAATSAKQDTGNTSLGTIAGAVSGTEMQVDVLTLPITNVQYTDSDVDITPTGNVIMWKATDGTILTSGEDNPLPVDVIGDVIVDPGTASSWGTYAEDSAHTSTENGKFILGVRNDSNSVLTDANGDYSAISVTNTGAVSIATVGTNQLSVTPFDELDWGVLREDTASNSGDRGFMFLGVRNDSNATLTSLNGDYSAIATNDKGAVAIQDGGNSITVDYATTGSGTSTGALRVELPTNGTGVVGLNAGSALIGKVSIDQVTANANEVVVKSITAGNNNIGDVDIASIAAGNNNIGDVDIASIAAGTNTIGDVGIKPRTTGGLSTYHLVSAATTNATNIKASAGQVFGWYIYNSNAAARKVVFHNTAGTPTAGASVFFSLMIPAGGAANVFSETGIAFSTGIAITTVTGIADSDSAAVAANDLIINVYYS